MLVAVQNFGNIWTARRVLQHEWRFGGEQIAEPVVHLRSRSR